jgi:hypothetical protein
VFSAGSGDGLIKHLPEVNISRRSAKLGRSYLISLNCGVTRSILTLLIRDRPLGYGGRIILLPLLTDW